MKKPLIEKAEYLAPELDIHAVRAEAGFAGSQDPVSASADVSGLNSVFDPSW